jgi:hypothetical protein
MKWARRVGMVPDGWVGLAVVMDGPGYLPIQWGLSSWRTSAGLVQFDRRCPAIGSGTWWAQAVSGR